MRGQYLDAVPRGGADPATTVAVFDLLPEGEPASRGVVYFRPAKEMPWPDPGIKAQLRRDGAGYALELRAEKLARAVWIDFGNVDADLADNALALLPGESLSVRLSSKASLSTLRKVLHLRSVADAVMFTKTR
jgi:beta-mannosidase